MGNEWRLLVSERRPKLLLNEWGVNLDYGFNKLGALK